MISIRRFGTAKQKHPTLHENVWQCQTYKRHKDIGLSVGLASPNVPVNHWSQWIMVLPKAIYKKSILLSHQTIRRFGTAKRLSQSFAYMDFGFTEHIAVENTKRCITNHVSFGSAKPTRDL